MKKILVVDDEASLVMMCKLVLEEDGFAVRGAYSGRQALQMIAQEMPDLVLLDVMMPGMNGIEVCRRIRETYAAERPLIFMYTADDREKTRRSSLQAGANDVITKDTPISQLATTIQAILPQLQ